jgi:hypothetical protein
MIEEKQIHVHINQLVGSVTICSKEDADNFCERLTKSLQKVLGDQYFSESGRDQDQDNQ